MKLLRLWFIGWLLADARRKRHAYDAALDRLDAALDRYPGARPHRE
jgi:hypothetical protein